MKNINIEQQEQNLKRLNEKILKTHNRIKKIPFGFLRDYAFKRYMNLLAQRDEIFKNLREDTRKKYPKRFTGNYK